MITVLVIILKFPLLNIFRNYVVVEVGWDSGVVLLSGSNESSHDILVNCLMILLVATWGFQVSVN